MYNYFNFNRSYIRKDNKKILKKEKERTIVFKFKNDCSCANM